MHTLFTLEDNYGLMVSEMDGEVCLKVDVLKNKDAARLQRCSVPGSNPLPCWRRAKSPKRITISGATITRSLIRPSAGQRYLRRNFVIYQYKMFD